MTRHFDTQKKHLVKLTQKQTQAVSKNYSGINK